MPNAYNYSNTAIQTTLSGNISAGATMVTVAATTGFPPSTPYVLALDYGAATEELIVVTNVGGTTLTVTRGFSGTSAQSHSIGAVVRHVVNAQDLTDFRTHEAATANVHGITGALAGVTETQTLTNKTLTSPTINSGALSGTFTGAHTYSGAVTLSGGGTLSGTFTGNPTLSGTVTVGLVHKTGAATDSAYTTMVTSDSVNRFAVRADGQLSWGSGSATRDVNLYRSAADVLRTDDSLEVGGEVTTNDLDVDNVATINTLTVNNLTPGSMTIPSGSLLAASSGWSVSGLSVGLLKAGMVTANINFTRSGADITVNSAGALSTGVIQMGTINATYAPDTDLGTLYMHAGNSIATGTARLDGAGVHLVRWQASQTISTGNIISATITYPL
ncbi:hypothetical protein ACWC1C_01305 [Streptomyces sp. NPDC001705]